MLQLLSELMDKARCFFTTEEQKTVIEIMKNYHDTPDLYDKLGSCLDNHQDNPIRHLWQHCSSVEKFLIELWAVIYHKLSTEYSVDLYISRVSIASHFHALIEAIEMASNRIPPKYQDSQTILSTVIKNIKYLL